MNAVLTYLGDGLIRGVDFLLGWILTLPRDFGLLVFALGTALLMTIVRRMVTNQDLLRRCSSDLRQLKTLRCETRHSADKPTLARLQATVGQIKQMQLAQDLRLLAFVLIPVGILAVWASARLDYIPPRQGEALIVRAYFPPSSVDQITHLVPDSGFDLKSTAIQIIKSTSQSPPMGVAEWTIVPHDMDAIGITIRHHGESAIHHLDIGGRTYQAPIQQHDGLRLVRTEINIEQYLPLGSHCGSKWLGLPPWMIGYLVLTLILVPVLKRLCSVA